jgi:hypothetical protein
MSENDTDGKKEREKSYRRKEFEKEDEFDVQLGKKTVVRLSPKKFYFSF